MKKIISILLVMITVSINFSFVIYNTTDCDGECTETQECNQTVRGNLPMYDCIDLNVENQDCAEPCTDGKQCVCQQVGGCACVTSTTDTSSSPTSVMGITCNENQLVNGQCKLNIYETLGIRKSVQNSEDPTSVGLFVQDVILSATFFIGTLVTVALIVSGIMFIFAASSGKDPANAKKGIIGSLVGLLIVVSSYVIIRLVQYIAKGF